MSGYTQLSMESVSAVTATPSVKLGTIRREGLNEYIYVYNMSTSTIDVGIGAIYSASSGYSVTASSVTGDNCAGVVKNVQIGPEEYGWLCRKGPCTVEIGDDVAGSRAVAQQNIVAMQSIGEFYPVTTGATGSTWAFTGCGVATTAIATGASGNVILNCQ